MHIKRKLRLVLKDLLVKAPITNRKDVVVNQQAVKNIILEEQKLSEGLKSQSQGGLLRILASDENNANKIAKLLMSKQNELPIRSVHIANQAIGYKARPKQEPIFNNSVIVKLNQKSLLKSAISVSGDLSLLRKDVLEGHGSVKNAEDRPQKIVIDFSSPNIAKPFHFGHLKSTILGNYLANLHRFLGNHVTRLNYIGDWGTQYGLLTLGMDKFGNDSMNDLENSDISLKSLLDIYVKANERGKSDESFYQEAKRRFLSMQDGTDPDQLKRWHFIRDLSLGELKRSYSRLGIEFDEYEFESDYAQASIKLVDKMKSMNFVRTLEDGVAVAQLDRHNRILEIPVQKSDGASLYITRDIAAAINRKYRFGLDQMLYVVGADQEKHFYSLKEILRKLGFDWWRNLTHVQMGKILNMSSRSGNSVLLSDIVDQATKQYIESTQNTPTTKVKDENEIRDVGKHLALSALFVYDMRNARTRAYEFDWSHVMLTSTRSGINLQTTFARLSSLLDKALQAGLQPFEPTDDNLDIDAICCEEAMNLLSLLDELDNELHSSYWLMDPNPLVNHALELCRAINRARQSEKLLILKESNSNWARTRLTLFQSAHTQLELIIRMIGLKPLYRV